MPIYKYEKSNKNFYYYAGKYIDPITKKQVQYKKRGFTSLKEAKESERKLLLSITQEGSISSLTFGDLYHLYYSDREKRIKLRSLKDISHTYERHLKETWAHIKIKDINLSMIISWQQHLISMTYNKKVDNEVIETGYSNEYLKTIQSMFKTIMKHGTKLGYNINNSLFMFDSAINKKEMKKEMLFWEPEEFNSFIDVVEDNQYNALFNLLYWTGIRIGEALALRWCDINFNTRTITINKTYDQSNRVITAPKTLNSNRNVMLPKKALESLKKWHSEAIDYYIDCDVDTHIIFGIYAPLDDNTIRRYKEKCVEQSNVKNIRIHDFRHSHVSLLINQEFNAFDIAKRMGHTVDMVNNRYGHWFNDSQQKMVDKLDKL